MTETKHIPDSKVEVFAPVDVLDELAQAYSFFRDPVLGKAIDEIVSQRRKNEDLKQQVKILHQENEILIMSLRDLNMKMEYDKK